MAPRYDEFDEYLFEGPIKRFFRSLSRLFLQLVLFLIVVAGVLVFFGPNLLSTEWGRDKIEEYVNRRIAGQVSIDTVSLSWFGEQSLAGVELRDPKGERVVRVTEAFVNTGLWEMLTKRKFIGEVTLSNPLARIVFDRESTNLHRALGWTEGYMVQEEPDPSTQTGEGKKITLRIPYAGIFGIDNGEIEIVQPDTLPVTFSGLSLRYQASERTGPLLLYAGGEAKQGAISGRFDTHVVVKGFNRLGELDVYQTSDGLYRTGEGSELNIRSSFQDMPVEGLDALFSVRFPTYQGIITAALGNRLNSATMVTMTPDDLFLQFKAGSPTLQAAISGRTEEGRFLLDNAGSATFTITPAFFRALSAYYPIPETLNLRQTSILNLSLNRLEIPLKDGGLNLPELFVDGDMSLTDTVLEGDEKFGRLSLKDIQMGLKAYELRKGLQFTLSSDMEYNEWQSFIKADVNLKDVLTPEGRLNTRNMTATVAINGQDLPVRVVDEWLSMDGMLVEALGERLNFRVATSTGVGDPIPQITLSLNSKTFQMRDAVFTVGDRWILQGEVPVTYQLAGALVNRFIPQEDPIRVEDNIPLTGTVTTFSLPNPVGERPELALQDIVFQADTKAGAFRLSGVPQVGDAVVQKMNLEISGPNLASMRVKAEASVEAQDKQKWVVRAGGDQFDFKLETGLRFGGEDVVELQDADVDFRSEIIESKVQADMKGLSQISVKEPLTTTYLLNEENSRLIGFGGAGQPSVVEPGRVTVTVDPFSFSARDFDLPAAQLKGEMHFDQLGLRLPDSDVVTRLSNAKISWEVDAPTNTLRVEMTADAAGVTGEPGSVELRAEVQNWLLGEEINVAGAQAGFSLNLAKVPVAMLEAFLKQEGLTEVLGQRVDGQIAAQLTSLAPPRGPVRFELKGEDLSARASIIVDQLITLADPDEPMYLEWNISPDRYEEVQNGLNKILHGKLSRLDALQLKEPTTLRAVISRLGFPTVWVNPHWAATTGEAIPQQFDPNLAALSLVVDFSNLTLVEPQLNQELTFNGLRFLLDAPTFASTVDYSILATGVVRDFALEQSRLQEKEANLQRMRDNLESQGYFEEEIQQAVEEESGRTEMSRMVVRGSVSEFLDENGNFNLMNTSISLNGEARGIPVRILGSFFHLAPGTREKLDAMFGKSLNSNASVDLRQMTGPVAFTVISSRISGKFEGEMVDGVFFLKKKAEVQIPVTPELSKYVLRYINPLLASATEADAPLRIEIEPSGVELPIIPTVDWSRANLNSATISMGRVKLQNKGPINAVLQLFKLSRLNTMKDMEIWFTPLYLSIRNGVVKVKRMDFLVADYFHMATWGSADLGRDQVGLLVGFTAESLRNGFGIKGLPPDYMLTVAVRGKLSDPQLNKKHAIGRILALYGQAYGGEKGRLLGGIVDKVLAGDDAPKATTYPTPWGDRDPLRWGEPDFFPEEDHPSRSYAPRSEFHLKREGRRTKLEYGDFKLKLKL